MPVFDRKCLSCDWATDFSLEKPDAVDKPCPTCGNATERLWTSSPTVIPDTFTTPLVDDVMARETQVFNSRSERKAAMRRHGLVEMIRHATAEGTDKSKQTTSWLSGPPAGFDPRPMALLSPDEQQARRTEWAAR